MIIRDKKLLKSNFDFNLKGWMEKETENVETQLDFTIGIPKDVKTPCSCRIGLKMEVKIPSINLLLETIEIEYLLLIDFTHNQNTTRDEIGEFIRDSAGPIFENDVNAYMQKAGLPQFPLSAFSETNNG